MVEILDMRRKKPALIDLLEFCGLRILEDATNRIREDIEEKERSRKLREGSIDAEYKVIEEK